MSWNGRFFDGQSAASRDVTLSVSANALLIRPDDGAEMRWSLDEIRWIHRPDASGAAQLARADDAARLDIADPALVAALRSVWPDIDRAAARQEKHGRLACFAAGSIAAIAGLIYAAAQFLPVLAAPLVPASVQRSIGEAAVSQILTIFGALENNEARVCSGAKGRAALDRLLVRLVPGNDPEQGIRVTVADMRTVNALAAPGGQLLVFRGLIDFADNAEEFTGVLAHEIGHARRRHPTQGMIREIGISATLGILTGSAGGQGLAGTAANVLVRTAYSRDAEREADDVAVDLLVRAGIGTEGMMTLFERFAEKGADLPQSMQPFSTHPRSEDRARHIQDRGGANTGPAMSAADWQAIKAMCGEG